jgi:hypothetical protein
VKKFLSFEGRYRPILQFESAGFEGGAAAHLGLFRPRPRAVALGSFPSHTRFTKTTSFSLANGAVKPGTGFFSARRDGFAPAAASGPAGTATGARSLFDFGGGVGKTRSGYHSHGARPRDKQMPRNDGVLEVVSNRTRAGSARPAELSLPVQPWIACAIAVPPTTPSGCTGMFIQEGNV